MNPPCTHGHATLIDSYCPDCGDEMRWKCKNCHAHGRIGAKFCTHCGYPREGLNLGSLS